MISRRKTILWSFLGGFAVLLGGFAVFAAMQGVPSSFWPEFDPARVTIDEDGIPTVEASTWPRLIEAQGMVIASERLWQMDLMRRKAAGRLSEWFGEISLNYDLSKRRQGWIATAKDAEQNLTSEDKEYCSAYAAGVNRFITDFRHKWGVEYFILGAEPEAWSCSDSLLILMLMAEELSSSADREASQMVWREHLSTAWNQFLFPNEHPWNHPMFGSASGKPLAIPNESEFIASAPISYPKSQTVPHLLAEQNDVGSNSWSWQGPNKLLLANDPHLATSVPALWHATRLRISAKEWVVGAAMPGLPGIVLGMNQSLGWAFTNTGEDVDDYLSETLSDDGNKYLTFEGGKEVWRPVLKQPIEVKVRGQESVKDEALFTHRGPLARVKNLGDGWYSRRWIALDSHSIGLPVVALNRAQNWEELNSAIDRLTLPSQNVLMADRKGNVGYRVSGRGIRRQVTGEEPQPVKDGEWLGFENQDQRRRQFFPRPQVGNRVVSTANQRIWVDTFAHHFSDDARQARIQEFLIAHDTINAQYINELQGDTTSYYHKILLDWIRQHTKPISDRQAKLARRWQNWTGEAKADPQSFAEAVRAEFDLTNLLLGKVKSTFLPKNQDEVRFWCPLRRAWILRTLSLEGGMGIFGFSDSEIAGWLFSRAAGGGDSAYYYKNRWQAQHPFVGRIPILGEFFRVAEYPQFGFDKVVRVEQPKFGASMRLVWDLSTPAESTWNFPVGQSGHVGSRHFADLQENWHRFRPKKVFPSDTKWEF
jgi:penicillin amidase